MFETLSENLLFFVKTYILFWPLFVLIERAFPYKHVPFFSRDLRTELISGLFNPVFMAHINKLLYTFCSIYILTPYLPFQIFNATIETWPFTLQVALAIFLIDFIQYLRHRFAHRFIWNFHAMHHAVSDLRASVHFKMHPIETIVNNLFLIIILYVLGFNAHAILWGEYIFIIYNLWNHININLSYPSVFRYLFASPNFHKWHHAKGIEGKDKNFCSIFPIFDILGKTYYYPKGQLPESYGVMKVDNTDPLYQSFSGAFMYPFKKMYKQFKKEETSS